MKIDIKRLQINFLGLTGGGFAYLGSLLVLRKQWFSTSSTSSQKCKEDKIAGNKSELSLALDNGESNIDRSSDVCIHKSGEDSCLICSGETPSPKKNA